MKKLQLLAFAPLAISTLAFSQARDQQRPPDLQAVLQQQMEGSRRVKPRQLSDRQRAELRRQLAEFSRVSAPLPARQPVTECKPAFPCPARD